MWRRAILHVDMDAFFASVEQLEDPRLRGRPVLVGSDRARGVVAAASYEARVYGCRSAQPMAVARRLCPHAVIVGGIYGKYKSYSRRIFGIMGDFTPAVEPMSIDEAFCDVTGSQRLLGDPVGMARRIRGRIKAEVGLTASVGVAENKFLAKVASDLDKPDGLTVIGEGEAERVLAPLAVGRIWGIGPKMEAKLAGMNIKTIGDLRRLDDGGMTRLFGVDADHYRNLSLGIDHREVTVDSEAKSIGQERTFEVDVADVEAVRRVMLAQAEQVGHRLRLVGHKAAGITVKIRYGDFKTITRARALQSPTDSTAAIYRAARDVFDGWAAAQFRPVRLIGVTATRLAKGGGQMGLFVDPAEERQGKVDRVMDAIVAKLGRGSIGRGG